MKNPYTHNCGQSMDYDLIKTMIQHGSLNCPMCRGIIIEGIAMLIVDYI